MKNNQNEFVLLLGFLAVFMIAAVGMGAYFYYQQKSLPQPVPVAENVLQDVLQESASEPAAESETILKPEYSLIEPEPVAAATTSAQSEALDLENDPKKSAADFCIKQGSESKLPLLLFQEIGGGQEQRYYVVCNKRESVISETLYEEIVFYDLKMEDVGEYSIVWSKESGCEKEGFCWRSASLPEIKDIDGDGINELAMGGSGYGGTCSHRWGNYCIYHYKQGLLCANDIEGWEQDLQKLKKDWADKACIFTEIKPRENNESCPGNEARSVCFSHNLNDADNEVFKNYIENNIKDWLVN